MTSCMTAEIKFRDREFESDSGWVHYYQDHRFNQRFLDKDGLMFCETLLLVRSSVDDAIALLYGPWYWWDHGRSFDFHFNGDGSCDQYLKPANWFWTKIGMRIFPPTEIPDGEGLRLPLVLWNHFVGTASFDVYTLKGAKDDVVLRGRFHGVENRVPLVPLPLATRRHLRAEAGNFLFPWPKGTGWIGLYLRLEQHPVPPSARHWSLHEQVSVT